MLNFVNLQQGQLIAGHFHRSQDVTWIAAPITILTVVLCPIFSKGSDYWGRKWFLVVPTLFGAVGSVFVSRASSMSMIIAGFTLIGVSFGAQSLLHTVASEVLPRRWRSWGQAAVMISSPGTETSQSRLFVYSAKELHSLLPTFTLLSR
jgi:MFS family permease